MVVFHFEHDTVLTFPVSFFGWFDSFWGLNPSTERNHLDVKNKILTFSKIVMTILEIFD